MVKSINNAGSAHEQFKVANQNPDQILNYTMQC